MSTTDKPTPEADRVVATEADLAAAAQETGLPVEALRRSAAVVAAAPAPAPFADARDDAGDHVSRNPAIVPSAPPPRVGPAPKIGAMSPDFLRRLVADELGHQPVLGRHWPEDPDRVFPAFPSPLHRTARGATYLRDAGVALIARPHVDLSGAAHFLDGLGDADGYLVDTPLAGAPSLVKFAGQLCYLSLDEDRTKNRDALRYLTNIKAQGHGSVFEHAHYAVLLWGVSRALTHEAVRHRIAGYSQVSQRYVPPRRLRFVEGREFHDHPQLHARFERWIEASAAEYAERERLLLLRDYPHDLDAGGRCARCGKAAAQVADGDSTGPDGQEWAALQLPCTPARMPTDARKKVRQAARRCLPNETEAPIVMSMNLRAWRHVVESRVSRHADVEIRRAYYRVFLCLAAADPLLWDDYTVERLPDGTHEITTPYRKV